MGGLKGPMLAVMLLSLPSSLLLTALLMLALQAIFSVGAVYLVAAAAGGLAPVGIWHRLVGSLLGARSTAVPAGQDHYATLGIPSDASVTDVAEAFVALSRRAADDPQRVAAAQEALAVLSDPLRRARYDAARLEQLACCPEATASTATSQPQYPQTGRSAPRTTSARSGWQGAFVTAAAAVAGGAVVYFGVALARDALQTGATPPSNPSSAGATGAQPVRTPDSAVAPGGEVQQVSMTLRYPRYEPALVEVKRGVPVRMTLQAIGEPG